MLLLLFLCYRVVIVILSYMQLIKNVFEEMRLADKGYYLSRNERGFFFLV